MVQNCCCYGCKEKYVKGGTVTFHSFPKDERRAKIWLQKINRENFVHSRHTKVCSKHFTEECFDREKFGGVWLKNDAVPTIFDYPQRPPKATARKRPAKSSLTEQPQVLPYSVEGSSQNQNEHPASIWGENVVFLSAPSASSNKKRRYSIWYISLLPQLLLRPEQNGPDEKRNRDVTSVVCESNCVQNDSAANRIQWEVAKKKKKKKLKQSHHRENRGYFCGEMEWEQKCEHTVVKEEPAEDEDELTCSATEEEYEYTSVKEEPADDHDESTCSATEEECELTIVKEEPADDLSESMCLAAEEVCDSIAVKVEQETEREGNSYEKHRQQEPEYIRVKGEPLDAEEGVAWQDTSCFW